MEMVLLDWTRMGKVCCLVGLIQHDGGLRVVRPLPTYGRTAPVHNIGWPPEFLRGNARWEVFELVGPAAAQPLPPHLEDIWVQNLRPRGTLAPPALRRSILQATMAVAGEPLFGAPLTRTRSTVTLAPLTGCRSLVTIVLAADNIHFTAVAREGAGEPDVRVSLDYPGLEGSMLAVKDHFLLCRAENAAPLLEGRLNELKRAVREMGPKVAVRLGLSRPFDGLRSKGPNLCWLMADGFFSLMDPQP
jgi:hypothetical protein